MYEVKAHARRKVMTVPMDSLDAAWERADLLYWKMSEVTRVQIHYVDGDTRIVLHDKRYE